MKRGAAALLLLLLCMSSSFGIFIKTVDLQEIYSGPDGVPLPGWDTVVDPYTYTKYQSVAEFVFTMSDVMYEYEIMPEVFAAPIVTVESGEDVVEPFTFGDASSGNYFAGTDYYTQQYRLTVVFDCQKSGKAVLSVELTTGLVDEEDGASSKNETIKFYFQKECKEEDHRDGFSVGRGSNSDNVVKHGVVQHRWAMESYEAVDREPVIMDSEEHQTVFHISMSAAGYGNQYFYPPTYVVEDDDMVDIQLRSEAIYGGVATSAVPHTLVVYYYCLASGDTEITISIDIGFYGVLQFGFTKVCALKGEEETGMPGQINVGMSRSNYAGIVTRFSAMTPGHVLRFWFEELKPVQWFVKDEGVDQIIRKRFQSTVQQAQRGELVHWRVNSSGRLAEIIVLDQFSRNIYRDQKESFQNDAQALTLSQELRLGSFDQELTDQQKMFAYMPFMHSESPLIHEEALNLFGQLGGKAFEFEQQHKEIIDRFGRYPHRNAILGRPNSPEEDDFLQKHGGF